MVTIWKYVGTTQLPTEAQFPASVLNEWAETLKDERARIKSSLELKVPLNKFGERIADPSSEAYSAFLQKVGALWDIDDIKMKQKVKLKRSEAIWRAMIEECFKEGGYFPTVVESKKNKFKAARYVLGAVGWKPDTTIPYGVWNPVVCGALLLRGDTRVYRYRSAIDTFINWGGFVGVLDVKKGALVSPSIIAEGVVATVMSQYMFEADLEADIPAYLTAESLIIKDFVDLALKAGAAATYDIDWNGSLKRARVTVECTVAPP